MRGCKDDADVEGPAVDDDDDAASADLCSGLLDELVGNSSPGTALEGMLTSEEKMSGWWSGSREDPAAAPPWPTDC